MTESESTVKQLLQLPGVNDVQVAPDGLKVYLDNSVWSDTDKERFHQLTKTFVTEIFAEAYDYDDRSDDQSRRPSKKTKLN